MRDFWRVEFLGNSLGEWTLALVTFLVTFTVLPIVMRYISAVRKRWTTQEQQQLHTALDLTVLLIERTGRVFIWSVALYLASRNLSFPPKVERWLTIVIVSAFWIQMALWAMASVRYAIDLRRKRSAGLDAL